MHVVLIRPNSIIKTVNIPLGLGYLSAALKKNGHAVSILDARLHRLSANEVSEHARSLGPDTVGVSALSFEAADAHAVASTIKHALPGTHVIFGGPYASAQGESILEDPNVDALVPGEGEETFPDLLDALSGSRPLEEVPGIAFRSDGRPRMTRARPFIENLDAYEVDWEAVDPPRYFSLFKRTAQNSIQRSSRVGSLFSSRGCPFGCIYCHNIFGRKYRTRSPGSLVREMERLIADYRIREFEMVDDAFNLDLPRAKAVARLILERGLNVHLSFPNGFRAEKVDAELLDLLKRAGCFRINYAVESASPRIQKMIGKGADLKKVKQAMEMTAARGIFTGGNFILGFPEETAEEMKATVEFAYHCRAHIASFFYLCPFPGTPLAKNHPKLAEKLRDTHIEDYSQITVNLSAVSDHEMSRICKQAYRGFYFRPTRMLRIVRVVPKNFRTLANVLAIIFLSIKNAVNY